MPGCAVVYFKPFNKKVPRYLLIPWAELPEEKGAFLADPRVWEERIFMASIESWPSERATQHSSDPFVVLLCVCVFSSTLTTRLRPHFVAQRAAKTRSASCSPSKGWSATSSRFGRF
eukprot:SAG11_NODE_1253_length_5385_cov_1.942679_6_plen_117_part_00